MAPQLQKRPVRKPLPDRQRIMLEKFLTRLLLASLLALLSGCVTVGPDYEEPDVAWLQDWQTDLYGQVTSESAQAEADITFWWKLFDDPVLNGLVADARAHSPTMQLAGWRCWKAGQWQVSLTPPVIPSYSR